MPSSLNHASSSRRSQVFDVGSSAGASASDAGKLRESRRASGGAAKSVTPEDPTPRLNARTLMDGSAGDSEVEVVDGELRQQLELGAFDADDAHRVRQAEDGFEHAHDERFGQDVVDAEAEGDGSFDRAAAGDRNEFLAAFEDILGVAFGEAAELGEGEVAADAAEELLAELRFEGADLRRDGGGGDEEPAAGGGDAAFARDDVEVVQMVVVQPVHAAREYVRKNRTVNAKFHILLTNAGMQ
jgi:hypothetical protein